MEQVGRFIDFRCGTGDETPGRKTVEPLFFVMAIMGCSDGSANCAEARVERAHYSTMQQCQAAMPAALMRNTDVDYPVVSATCRMNGQQMVQARGGAKRNG